MVLAVAPARSYHRIINQSSYPASQGELGAVPDCKGPENHTDTEKLEDLPLFNPC